MTFSAHNVVSLFRARPPVRDWDNAELAQFFRVEAALRQAGIFVDTQRGLTDEGDPWFVYCRQDTGDVFLHIARFDGLYFAASPSMATPLVRKRFDELLDELVRENPVMLSPSPNRRPGPDLYIHPSTMLIAAVAALFYKNMPVRADDHGDNQLRQSELRAAQSTGMMSDVFSVALVSAMAIIAVLHHTNLESVESTEGHSNEMAFLDGILFEGSAARDDLPRFEGNTGPTDTIEGASPDAIEVVVADHVLDNAPGAEADVAMSLQSLFGKFADTIIAASAVVSDSAELAVAHRVASAESQMVRGDEAVVEGGEKVLASHGASSATLVIASNAAQDLKSGDQAVQQVALSPAQAAPVNEQVQMAALTLPTAASMLTSALDSTSTVVEGGGKADSPSTVDAGSSGSGSETPVIDATPVFYNYVQAGGMFVLLGSPDDAAATAQSGVLDISPADITALNVPLVGVAHDSATTDLAHSGDLLAVA